MRSMVVGGFSVLKDIAPKASAGGIQRARRLRRQMSLPEVLFWRILRQRHSGLKFRRQHQTGDYVLDFYCNDARLAVEIDGIAHDSRERAERDGSRDAWLCAHGIETIRISASEVLADAVSVAEAIVEYSRARLPLHHPAAPGGPPPRDELGED